jgi:phage terminase large subunit-like protein
MSSLPRRSAIEAQLLYLRQHKIDSYYPETGPLRRELYVKHMQCFEAGARFAERCFMAANRVGKSEGVGAYEMTLHLTGKYPDWWKGRRFSRPVSAWGAGKDAKTVRDILQLALLGPGPQYGTGMIPADAIINTTPKVGTPEAVEMIYVKHVSGGRSDLQFKSYDSGPESFYGTKKDVVWLDEEAEQKIYSECLTRTASTVPGEPNGIILVTFTPLWGMTELAKEFIYAQEGNGPKCLITASWDEAPHLSKETRDELYKSIPPHEREARTEGRPMLGSGAVYPVPEREIVIDDFAIPSHFVKAYGLDVGWQKTAAIFGAWDRTNDTVYLTGEHYRGLAEPAVHAQAIKARGNMPGFIDPASNASNQVDGRKLFQMYRTLGLDVRMADNARESGIFEVWQRLSSGRLKVFKSCRNWLSEFRIFARDENGKIKNEQTFHLMAATRYLLNGPCSHWVVLKASPAPLRRLSGKGCVWT